MRRLTNRDTIEEAHKRIAELLEERVEWFCLERRLDAPRRADSHGPRRAVSHNPRGRDSRGQLVADSSRGTHLLRERAPQTRATFAIGRGDWSLSVAHGSLLLSLMTEMGLRTWRVVAWETTEERLSLEAARRMGAERALLELIPCASESDGRELVAAARRVRCERMAELVRLTLAGAKVESARLSRGARRGEPGHYARILLRTRHGRVAVTGPVAEIGAHEIDAFIASALIWFMRLGERRNAAAPHRLWLITTRNTSRATAERLALLRAELRDVLTLYEVDDAALSSTRSAETHQDAQETLAEPSKAKGEASEAEGEASKAEGEGLEAGGEASQAGTEVSKAGEEASLAPSKEHSSLGERKIRKPLPGERKMKERKSQSCEVRQPLEHPPASSLLEHLPASSLLERLPVPSLEALLESAPRFLPPSDVVLSESARRLVALAPEAIDVVRARRGETLRFRGLAFARVRRVAGHEQVWFGVEGVLRRRLLDEDSYAELLRLVGQLAAHRRAETPDPRHALYRAAPEAWLESLLRRDISRLDPGLRLAPLHAQFRTPHDGRTGAARHVDLLAMRRDGRLVVIELKVSEDAALPLQSADYWRRVEAQRRRGRLARARLFGDAPIAEEPPLVYSVAPLLSFHRDFDMLARAITPEVQIYRFDLNEDWRAGIHVARRVRIG